MHDNVIICFSRDFDELIGRTGLKLFIVLCSRNYV